MPKSSGKFSTQPLPANASLENLRKQSKTLLNSYRANEADALERVKAFHPELRKEFSLSDAQFVVAQSYGFSSWPKLKHHVEAVETYTSLPADLNAADNSDSPVDRVISLACLNYANDHESRRTAAKELLANNPSLASANFYSAVTVGNVDTVEETLRNDRSAATRRGGPHTWEPILYATYSRFNSTDPTHSTLKVTQLLLENGADPNAGFLWDRNYLFTGLTGVFGEGERGPIHQPEHQFCYQLARLLLEAGADPNDGQTLYNRMFRGGTRHLELLFEFGLGKGGDGVWFKRLGNLETPEAMLQQQMAWAAKYNQLARMKLLVEHGVDVNAHDSRFDRSPYEIAILNGNREMAEYLLSQGAIKTGLSLLDEFKSACVKPDGDKARSLLKDNPTLVTQLGRERVELLSRAVESHKPEAIRLMLELGFDVNERKRTAVIHIAASSGSLEMVKFLIELGADPMVRDEEFNGTPLGWSDFSNRTEVSDYLRSIGCTL